MKGTIRCAWMVISYENLDVRKGHLNFESLFNDLISIKLHKDIKSVLSPPFLLRKVKIQEKGIKEIRVVAVG